MQRSWQHAPICGHSARFSEIKTERFCAWCKTALSLERCVGCHIVCRWHLLLLLRLPHNALQCRLLRAMHHSPLRVHGSLTPLPHSISFPRLWGSRVLFAQNPQMLLIRPLKAASATAQSASKTVFLRPIQCSPVSRTATMHELLNLSYFWYESHILWRGFVGTIVVLSARHFAEERFMHSCSVRTMLTLRLEKSSGTSQNFVTWWNLALLYWVTSQRSTAAIVSCRRTLLHSTGSSNSVTS